MRWHVTPHDPLPRGVFRVCEEAIIFFPQIVTTCSRQLILAHRFIGVKGLIRMEWELRMSRMVHPMGDRRENWLDPGGGQGKNKIPGAPGDPTVDVGQGTVRLLRQFCRILARIIHEDTPFVNNAPAGAGSTAPAGFDWPLARPAQG